MATTSLYASKFATFTDTFTNSLKSCTETVRVLSRSLVPLKTSERRFNLNSNFKFPSFAANSNKKGSSSSHSLQNDDLCNCFVVSAKANRVAKKARSHSSKSSVLIVDKDEETDKQFGSSSEGKNLYPIVPEGLKKERDVWNLTSEIDGNFGNLLDVKSDGSGLKTKEKKEKKEKEEKPTDDELNDLYENFEHGNGPVLVDNYVLKKQKKDKKKKEKEEEKKQKYKGETVVNDEPNHLCLENESLPVLLDDNAFKTEKKDKKEREKKKTEKVVSEGNDDNYLHGKSKTNDFDSVNGNAPAFMENNSLKKEKKDKKEKEKEREKKEREKKEKGKKGKLANGEHNVVCFEKGGKNDGLDLTKYTSANDEGRDSVGKIDVLDLKKYTSANDEGRDSANENFPAVMVNKLSYQDDDVLSKNQDSYEAVNSNSLPVYKQEYKILIIESLKFLHFQATDQLNRLSDKPDEETVHNIRVSLRRLRTAVLTFQPCMDIPKELNTNQISKLLRVLGDLRDKDVMQTTFTTIKNHSDILEKDEIDLFESLQKKIKNEREKVFPDAINILKSKPTVQLFQSLSDWLEKPSFKKEFHHLVNSPSELIIPSLLLQQTVPLFLHPGWHINDLEVKKEDTNKGSKKEKPVKVLKENSTFDESKSNTVHDLRKGLRELRYSMELLRSVYGERERYGNVVTAIRKLQGFLGDLQDIQVLATYLHKKMNEKTPNLSLSLSESQNEVWRCWKEEKYILHDNVGQQELIRVISRPRGPKP